MWLNLLYRICLMSGFIFSAWKWGNWRDWRNYYHSMLFVMVVNFNAAYISYHHRLWFFNPDAFVSTLTVQEIINTYTILPATALIYLSNFPANGGSMRKAAYILLWVAIYGTLEFIDSKIVGGISYTNGWSWPYSLIFDWFLFVIVRIHHTRPLLGWLCTFVTAYFILTIFNFLSAEMR